MLHDKLLVHVPGRALPRAVLGFVDGVDDVEGLWVFGLESVEFGFEEDVRRGDVGEDEGEFGFVGGVGEGMGEDLVHRCTGVCA